MFRKKHIADRLYDFLTGELEEAERTSIEKHLERCPRCVQERHRLEQAFEILSRDKLQTPELPDEYWENYWRTLQPKLQEHTPSAVKEFLERWRFRPVRSLFSPRLAYGLIGFALGAIVMLGILFPYLGRKGESRSPMTIESPPPQTESLDMNTATAELSEPFIRFFQKTKAFLIAVKNLDEPKEGIKELLSDRERVLRLAAECQSLQQQALDPREQELLSELRMVLAQLSTVTAEGDTSKLDLVREEIERNNLVMKVRVHEIAHEVRLLQTAARESAGND